jgi:predicted Zn-dependent peptidase
MDDLLFRTDELRSLGTDESFEGLDRTTLLAWHRRFDHPGLCRLVVAGGVDPDVVRAATGPIPERTDSPETPELVRAPSTELVAREPGTGPGAELWIGLLLPADEVGPASEILRVLVGNTPSSMLWRRLRAEDGLAYCVDADLRLEPDGARLALYAGLGDAADVEEARGRLVGILEDLARDGPTEEELAGARRIARLELHRELAAPDGAVRWLLRTLRPRPGTPEDANRLVEDREAALLGATRESVRDAATALLDRGRRAVSVVGDVDRWDPAPAADWLSRP